MALSGTGRWSRTRRAGSPWTRSTASRRFAHQAMRASFTAIERSFHPGRNARLGVASREVVEDSADHAPAKAGGVEAIEARGVAGPARNLGPLPAELSAPGVRDDSPGCVVQDRREGVGRPVGAVAQERAPVVLADGERLLAKGVAYGVRPPPQVLQRPVLARIAEPDRSRPGAGDGCGGLISGHGTRTDFLRFRTTRSAFVLILPWAAAQVIGRWRRSGQISYCSTAVSTSSMRTCHSPPRRRAGMTRRWRHDAQFVVAGRRAGVIVCRVGR